MIPSRYTMVHASFWTADPDTRGLSALAACIYLRATTESLVGVLQRSPRALAAAHPPATEAEAVAALDELAGRTRADGSPLARFWPESDTFALWGWARQAKGKAKVAAERELAAFSPEIAAFAMGHPMGDADGGGVSKHEHEQQHEQKQVASLPLRLASPEPAPPARKRKPKRDYGAEVEAVLARIDQRRVELGDDPLPTYKREPATIRARLNDDGVTLQLLLDVVDVRAEDCRRNPGQLEWLDAVSPFTKAAEGRGGWPQSLRMLERRQRSGTTAKPAAAPFGVDMRTGKPWKSDAERVEVERLRSEGERILAGKGGARG